MARDHYFVHSDYVAVHANNIYIKINTATIATISSTGIAANLTGDVTGDVTGNVTGNVTGVLDGEVTGSVFADNSTLMVDAINNAMITDMMKLTPLSAEPADPTVGMICVADKTNWDPLTSGGARPYVVFYDGAIWTNLSSVA